MVIRPTRGNGPRRHGEGVQHIPDVGPADLDVSVYSDPQRYELERTKVLRHSWLVAARSEEIPKPRDYVVYEGHGETVVIVRRDDGTLSAFHNVCQHRGARIATQPSGHCDRHFVCPWHGWAYDLDGSIKGVPDRGDFAACQLKDLHAPSVAVEEWGGWVWIFLSPSAAMPNFADYLGEVGGELAAYRMDEMFLAEKRVYEVPVNYKAIVDGFNELYHIAELHHVPRAGVETGRDTAYHILGRHSMMVVPLDPVSHAQLVETGDHQATVTCHYVVFPNCVFNNLPNHLQVFNPIPTGPHTTKFICWELQYRSDDAKYRQEVDMAWTGLKRIVEEDVFIFNQLAATRDSMAYRTNRFNERECKPTVYHETMARMVGDNRRIPVRRR